MSTLEIIGVIVSALAIWLTARRNMACWPVGLASVALYGWIFHDARLYSDMLLQGAFAVLQVYGWWRWHAQRHAASSPELAVVHTLPPRALLAGVTFAAVASAALGTLMGHFTDAALPFADATLTALSLVAQYWTARRYLASWPLWSAVNVAYVGMFLSKGLYPTAGLYALFIALAVIGWRDWKRAGGAAPAAAAPLLQEAAR